MRGLIIELVMKNKNKDYHLKLFYFHFVKRSLVSVDSFLNMILKHVQPGLVFSGMV